MKKKIIIGIVLLVLGISIFTLGFILKKDNSTKDNKKNNDPTENEVKSIYDENTLLKISNFSVEYVNENDIKLKFSLENEKDETFENQTIYLNFYQDDKIIYTFDYLTPELLSDNMITVETVLSFEYQKIDKYEFVINNQKIEKVPDIIS